MVFVMKNATLFYMAMLFVIVAGCSRAAPPSATEPVPGAAEDPASETYPDQKTNELVTEFVSTDGRVTVHVEQVIIDDKIPQAVHKALSNETEDAVGESDNVSGTAFVFLESEMQFFDSGTVTEFLAVFLSFGSIEGVYLVDPRGFGRDKPLLVDVDGDEYERMLLMFEDAGSAVTDTSGLFGVPPGTVGLLLFEYPSKAIPREVHYIYSYRESEDSGIKKGMVIIPLRR
ncbi:MAG TPA: hypothetical protein VLH18_06385 [Candidatus Limnocylindrales bacterium]|nr:hypothetical protein [Candidatus Limnocylindrales bacterium]